MSSRDKDRGRETRSRSRERYRERSRSRERYRERSRSRERRRDEDPSGSRRRSRSRDRRDDRPGRSGGSKHNDDDNDRGGNQKDNSINTKKQLEETRKERMALAKTLANKGSSSDESDDEDGEVGTDELGVAGEVPEQDMLALFGFAGFDSTKGKSVSTNLATAANGAVSKPKRRIYRQYMNRRGGFNRPLQKLA